MLSVILCRKSGSTVSRFHGDLADWNLAPPTLITAKSEPLLKPTQNPVKTLNLSHAMRNCTNLAASRERLVDNLWFLITVVMLSRRALAQWHSLCNPKRQRGAEAVDPSFALNANRKLATFAKERGDLEAFKKYSKAVDRIVQSSDMGIGRKISLLRESLRNRSSGPEDKEYLAAMEAMWNNPKYFPYKEILDIGDELCLAYFFSKPLRQQEFVSTAKEFRARLLLHGSEDTPMKELAANTMFVRHSLMVTEYAATYGDSGLQSKDVRREFQEAAGDGEVTLGVPAGTNGSERLSRFVSIFQKRFPAAYAEFEKKAATPKNDAVSVDPPVAKTGEKTP